MIFVDRLQVRLQKHTRLQRLGSKLSGCATFFFGFAIWNHHHRFMTDSQRRWMVDSDWHMHCSRLHSRFHPYSKPNSSNRHLCHQHNLCQNFHQHLQQSLNQELHHNFYHRLIVSSHRTPIPVRSHSVLCGTWFSYAERVRSLENESFSYTDDYRERQTLIGTQCKRRQKPRAYKVSRQEVSSRAVGGDATLATSPADEDAVLDSANSVIDSVSSESSEDSVSPVNSESRLRAEDPCSNGAQASTSGRQTYASSAGALLYPPSQRRHIRRSWWLSSVILSLFLFAVHNMTVFSESASVLICYPNAAHF